VVGRLFVIQALAFGLQAVEDGRQLRIKVRANTKSTFAVSLQITRE
jgi:hypothetical protein